MTITVLMTQTRQGDAGATLTAGQTYDLRDDLAIQLVGNGYAVDVYKVIQNVAGKAPDYLGEVANEAAMLALVGAQVGQYCKRTDTNSTWVLDVAPPTKLASWRQMAAAGGGSGGGGGGGAMGDREAVVPMADPNAPGYSLPDTETVGGITWDVGFNAQSQMITYTWAAGGLSRSISYSSGLGYVASGNRFGADGALEVTVSQMPTLLAALIAQNTRVSQVFRVLNFDGTRDLLLQYDNSSQGFMGAYGTPILVAETLADDPAGAWATINGESGDRWTATIPGWLARNRGIIQCDAGAAGNGTVTTKGLRWYASGGGGGQTVNSSATAANSLSFTSLGRIQILGSKSSQIVSGNGAGMATINSSSAAFSNRTTDTAADWTLAMRYVSNNTGETILYKWARVSLHNV